MKSRFRDGRLLLERLPEDREPILKRLRRIEGQIRGVQQMVMDDRHCADEIQQINAAIAGLREVMLLLVGQHLSAGIELAAHQEDGTVAEAVEDMQAVLRSALRRS